MSTRTIIKASRDQFWGPQIDFKIGQITSTSTGETMAIAKPLELEAVDPNRDIIHIPPTFSLMPDEAQQFMDELWHIGMRPSEGTGSAGQMAATTKHLEDMRRLVFQNIPKS